MKMAKLLHGAAILSIAWWILGANLAFAQAGNYAGGRTADARSATGLPTDVYRDSLGRLPTVKVDELDGQARLIVESIIDPNQPNPGSLSGPVGMWLNSPDLAKHMFAVRTYLRFGTQFDRRITELASLVAGRELENQYIWRSHERFAREAGLEPEIIEIVNNRKSIQGLGEKEAVIILFGRELLGSKKVSSNTFARALKVFGKRGVTDLSAIIGFYSFIAVTVGTFDLQSQ